MKIFDNVLGKKTLQLLQKEVVENSSFPWYKTNALYDIKEKNSIHNYSWFHMIFNEGEISSQTYSLIYPMILSAFDNIDEPINHIMRFRLALQTSIGTKFINDAHVDFPFEHKTALMYLNSCDGETLIYNETYDIGSKIHPFDYLRTKLKNNLTILQEINPVENRMILFNGMRYHSSQRPINFPYRITLNINYN